MSITVPAMDESPRTSRASIMSNIGDPTSFAMTVIAYVVIGFMVFVIIAAVIDKIVEVVTGEPPKTSLVELIIDPIQKVLNAIGNAIAAPFSGIAKIFNTSWYSAKPLGTAFYYFVFIVIPVIALVVWFYMRRR